MKKSALSMAVAAALAFHGVAHGASDDDTARRETGSVRHVVLISVDGLHQNDVDWYVSQHPASTLARMVHGGASFKNARTPFPSDSFPGMVGLTTGGNPRSTGIYYDDAYSRSLLPVGTTDCAHTAAGAEVQFAENVDKNSDRLDAGQNIPGLYNNFDLISQLSSNPANDLIDPAQLPVDAKTCQPVWPHQYLKVNTVFEVLHAHGLRTAWSDKHPAYDILNGPSGKGIDDLFAPEINGSVTDPSLPAGVGPDFTKDNLNTQRYDDLKVKTVLRWLQGYDHTGQVKAGVPALMGLNFQTVSTAQKLNFSSYVNGQTGAATSQGLGGYVLNAAGQPVPGPVLEGALNFIDHELEQMLNAADLNQTVFIVTAKHGQSPERRADLTIIDDGAMLDALNAAWATKTGSAATPLVAHAMDDDGVLLWLSDHSEAAARFAANFLRNYSGTGIGSDASGSKIAKPFSHAGLKRILAGQEAAAFIGVSHNDDRVPDVIGIAQVGSVFAGSKLSKIAEHGGDAEGDRHVGLVVYGKGVKPAEIDEPVELPRVAPTILKLLGQSPEQLRAVRLEGTRPLPGLGD